MFIPNSKLIEFFIPVYMKYSVQPYILKSVYFQVLDIGTMSKFPTT